MAATVLGVISVVGLFNVLIDPLGVFGAPKVTSLNALKPYLDHHRELSRYQRARRFCSNAGIFGNSRAEVGFDPESHAFLTQGLSAFNHAIPGKGVGTAYRQILWLQAANCLPKTVFLGVEFFDFLGGDVPLRLPSLHTDPPPRIDHRFFAEAVFSISGFRDSLVAIFLQHSRYPAISTERGFNPIYNYIPEVGRNGHYAMFRQRAEENIRHWQRKSVRIRPQGGGSSDDEVLVDAMLSVLTQARSTTYLIIYPYHAQIRVIIERLGMGKLFADWKRLLVAIAEREGKVEVWDFSGVSSETLESIPAKGDRQTHLRYYWEAGHFKKTLGDLVIARLLGREGNFGIKLDSSNIDRWLIEDRARVKALLEERSSLTSEIDEVFSRHAVQ